MGDNLQLDPQPAVTEQPIKPPVPKLNQKRRSPLTPFELATIRELAARGESSSEIATKLGRPTRTIRAARRTMGLAKPPSEPPAAESQPAENAAQKRAKPHTPFTAADRVRIANLVAGGLTAAQIAERIHRGLPQVSKVVRELASSTKQPTSVPVQCPAKIWDLLSAAARRRNLDPAHLALQIMEGVLKRGSVDAAIRTDEHVDDLRVVQVTLSLEATGRANNDTDPHACRDYRLRGVALAHGEQTG